LSQRRLLELVIRCAARAGRCRFDEAQQPAARAPVLKLGPSPHAKLITIHFESCNNYSAKPKQRRIVSS
jgi:hypothetical protein